MREGLKCEVLAPIPLSYAVIPAGIAGIQIAGMPTSQSVHGAWFPAIPAGMTMSLLN